jgi:hypothetical protein
MAFPRDCPGLGGLNLGSRPPKRFPHADVHSSQTLTAPIRHNCSMNAEALTHALEEFLGDASGAVVIEDGGVMFDLAQAKYSISGEHNKCLLHLWSPERNTVRRVLDAEVKSGTLRLAVQRLGQAQPTKLEICRERDRRCPTAKRAARVAYEARLRRAIERHFPGFAISRLTTRVDLERSFGPIYARGLLRQGQTAFVLLGVNASETQSSIDAALTFGILWLDLCRESSGGKFLVEGLVLFVPAGTSSLVRERMANLNRAAAKWRLFEFDERHDSVIEMDCTDRGNIATRLVHATNETAALERFDDSITRVQTILQNCEVVVLSPAELAFRWRGLEFASAHGARGRHLSQPAGNCFRRGRGRAGAGRLKLAAIRATADCVAECPASLRAAPRPFVSHASRVLAGVAGARRRQRNRRAP